MIEDSLELLHNRMHINKLEMKGSTLLDKNTKIGVCP